MKVRKNIVKEAGVESEVYDISLDGTFVNAFGMNVLSNTDGFNFQVPDDSLLVEKGVQEYVVPREEGDNDVFDETVVFCTKNLKSGDAVNMTLRGIVESEEEMEILTIKGWVKKSDFVFEEVS